MLSHLETFRDFLKTSLKIYISGEQAYLTTASECCYYSNVQLTSNLSVEAFISIPSSHYTSPYTKREICKSHLKPVSTTNMINL